MARKILEAVKEWLTEADVLLKKGTLMNATIIGAPCSAKNKAGERDPETHQTIKQKN